MKPLLNIMQYVLYYFVLSKEKKIAVALSALNFLKIFVFKRFGILF